MKTENNKYKKYNMNVRKFKRFLTFCGFKKIRQNGSHIIYSNNIISQSLTEEKATHSYSQGHLKKLLKDFNLSILELESYL